MEKLTLQQVFNNAWNAFVVRREGPGQGFLASVPTCLYRAPNGCKCAIGHSIPDDQYKGEEWSLRYYANKLFNAEYRALRELQMAHDAAAWGDEFHKNIEKRFRLFADEHSLEIPCEPIPDKLAVVFAHEHLLAAYSSLVAHKLVSAQFISANHYNDTFKEGAD